MKMKHIKTYRLFENLNIDTEEVELLLVNLTDNDFQVHVSKIYDGLEVEIERGSFSGIEIKEELLFAIDLIKKKYNLVLTKISFKSRYSKGRGSVDNIEKIFSEEDNSSFTRLKYLELYFTKEKEKIEPKKGIVRNFLDRFKSKEMSIEERIIGDDISSCKRYINNLKEGNNYQFFVSNKETLNQIIRDYGGRLVQKDLKETDGGFIVTIEKLALWNF